MRKLNFGCGSIQPEGWYNVDQDPAFGALDWPLSAWKDDHFDIVVAHCALQTNTYDEIPGLLAELRRIIKPGGVLRFSLPNIVRGFQALQAEDIEWFPNGEDNIEDRFSNWLTWYSTTRSLWTMGAIANRLFEAEFFRVDIRQYGVSTVPEAAELDDREHECFFMEAFKA